MTAVDDLWYLADEADQQAEQAYHRLADRYDARMEFETTKHVSRDRFRTVARRIRSNGAPFGVQTLVSRPNGDLLLVRHEAVGKWVLPGGETRDGESFKAGAERELAEEAGMTVEYDGLGMVGHVTFHADGHTTWGVLPIFEARVGSDAPPPTVCDPDDEITDARWFAELPPDTRDRPQLQAWREQRRGD